MPFPEKKDTKPAADNPKNKKPAAAKNKFKAPTKKDHKKPKGRNVVWKPKKDKKAKGGK